MTIAGTEPIAIGPDGRTFRRDSVFVNADRDIEGGFYWPEKSCFLVMTRDERGNPDRVELFGKEGNWLGSLASAEGLRPYYFAKLASGEPGVVCSIYPPLEGWADWNCSFDLDAMRLVRLSPSK